LHGGRILEVAVAILEGGTIHLAFEALLDPGTAIPPWVARLTGITDGMVAGRPRFGDVAAEVARALDAAVFVAHNARFDWRFLAAECVAVGAPAPRRQTALHRPPHPPSGAGAAPPRARPRGGVLRGRQPGTPPRFRGCARDRRVLRALLERARERGVETLEQLVRAARPAAAQARQSAECGMRNAEYRGERRSANDLSLQFRTPHSAFRTPRMTHTTFKVGHLTCHALEGGTQRLDGGAMFGVVPKPLWQRRIPR